MGRLGLTLPLLSLLMLCGCPPPVPSDGGNDGIPSLDSAGNGSFNSATIVPLDGSGFFEFTGSIQSSTDVDM